MYNSKKKLSVVAVLFIAFVMLFASAFTLMYARNVKATTVSYESTSGAEIRLQRSGYNDAIKFVFEIKKDALADYADGGTATMYFMPTTLLDGAPLTKDTADVGSFAFGTKDEKWTDLGDSYRFVANQDLPRNGFGVEITAVMYFEKGEQTLYSDEMTRSMRFVARKAYDDPANQDKQEILTAAETCLLYYDSKEDTQGERFTVNYVNVDGTGNVYSEEKAYLYGDNLVANDQSLKDYGWMDDTTLKTDITEITAKTVEGNVSSGALTVNVVKNLGEIVTDGVDAYNPNNLAFTKLVSATNGTVYYENNTLKNIPANDANEKLSDAALATNGDTTTGYVTVSSIKKIINEAKDLASLYIDKNDVRYTGESDKINWLKNNPINGYFLVANDIKWDSENDENNHYATPASNPSGPQASVFGGVLDGAGHTVEFGLGRAETHSNTYKSAGGLLGGLGANSEVKDIALIVKGLSDDVNKSEVPILEYKGNQTDDKKDEKRPQITNVYMAYGENLGIVLNPANAHALRLGLVAYDVGHADMNNVIIDCSNVDFSDITTGTTSYERYSFFGATVETYTESAGHIKTLGDCYIITNAPYLYYEKPANGTATTHDESFGIDLTKVANYTELKAYFAQTENEGLLEEFAGFTDISMGIPFAGDKQAFVNSETIVKDGETPVETITFTAGESGEKTINLSFLGDICAAEVVSNNTNVIDTTGNQVTYNGGFATGITLTVTATIQGVEYEKVLNVEFTGLNSLGTIYIDDSEVYTDDLTGTYTSLNVVAADNTTLVTSGVKESSITNATNQINDDYKNAYVFDGDTIKGTANVIVVKKVINEASDLASLYNAATDTDFEAGYNACSASKDKEQYLINNAITGYYLVINDILWDTATDSNNHYANPFYVASVPEASLFAGVLDGAGHTVEFGLGGNAGLIGSLYEGGQVKDISLIVKGVTASEKRFLPILEARGYTFGQMIRPIMKNIYFAYGDGVITSNILSNAKLQLGFVSGNLGQVDMYDIIMDYGNIDFTNVEFNSKTNYNLLLGSYGSNAAGTANGGSYNEGNGLVKMHSGCYAITNASLVYKDSRAEFTTFTETGSTVGYTQCANYAALGDTTITINNFTITASGVTDNTPRN